MRQKEKIDDLPIDTTVIYIPIIYSPAFGWLSSCEGSSAQKKIMSYQTFKIPTHDNRSGIINESKLNNLSANLREHRSLQTSYIQTNTLVNWTT